MRTLVRFFLVVFFFTLAAYESFGQRSDSGAQNITSIINTARYILFGGSYVILGGGADNRESAVFKLDTYTGKTWILKVEKSVNGRVACWVPVEESAVALTDARDDQKKDNGQKAGVSKSLRTLDE